MVEGQGACRGRRRVNALVGRVKLGACHHATLFVLLGPSLPIQSQYIATALSL